MDSGLRRNDELGDFRRTKRPARGAGFPLSRERRGDGFARPRQRLAEHGTTSAKPHTNLKPTTHPDRNDADPAAATAARSETRTFWPTLSRSAPRTTTLSPAESSPVTAVSSPSLAPDFTSTRSAVLSGLMRMT